MEPVQVMGRNLVEDFISDEFKESVGMVLNNALQGQETANFEFPLYTKSGTRVEVLLNAATRRDANGYVIGVVGVGQDITERKKAEQQVENMANDLKKLIDTANAPIFGIDSDGKVRLQLDFPPPGEWGGCGTKDAWSALERPPPPTLREQRPCRSNNRCCFRNFWTEPPRKATRAEPSNGGKRLPLLLPPEPASLCPRPPPPRVGDTRTGVWMSGHSTGGGGGGAGGS